MEVQMYLGCVLVVCMWVCRWAHQLGGSKHLIPPVSCAMSFTGTLRLQEAQVRHTVVVRRYNIWGEKSFWMDLEVQSLHFVS